MGIFTWEKYLNRFSCVAARLSFFSRIEIIFLKFCSISSRLFKLLVCSTQEFITTRNRKLKTQLKGDSFSLATSTILESHPKNKWSQNLLSSQNPDLIPEASWLQFKVHLVWYLPCLWSIQVQSPAITMYPQPLIIFVPSGPKPNQSNKHKATAVLKETREAPKTLSGPVFDYLLS